MELREKEVHWMTLKQRYNFPYKFLLSAIYDTADQIGAQLTEGNSCQGVFRIRMPENCAEVLLQAAAAGGECEITLAADTSKPQINSCAQESDAAQYFLSELNSFLAGFKEM